MVDGFDFCDMAFNVLINATKVRKIEEIAKEKRKYFSVTPDKAEEGVSEDENTCIGQKIQLNLQCFSEREELK